MADTSSTRQAETTKQSVDSDIVITYVYDGVEVVKTGREATKTVRPNVTDTLQEIKPFDTQLPTWRKWVRPTDLYEIKK